MSTNKTSIRFGVLLSILGFGVFLTNLIPSYSINSSEAVFDFMNLQILLFSLIILGTCFFYYFLQLYVKQEFLFCLFDIQGRI